MVCSDWKGEAVDAEVCLSKNICMPLQKQLALGGGFC